MKSGDLPFILNFQIRCYEVIFSLFFFLINVLTEPGVNPLKTGGWLLYVPPGFTFCHAVFLCVLCGSQNKQRLFHCTTLTDWFV
jgi:hypothetical protein